MRELNYQLFLQVVVVCVFLAVSNGQPRLYQDSLFVDFDYNPTSPVGPSEWSKVDCTESEWVQYDEGHPIFDLGIAGDGEAEASECGNDNNRKSPLALFPADSCEDTHEILTRQISSDDCSKDDMTFLITPYTLKAYMPLDDDSCERPTIEVPGFDDEFILVWMELHARSEHIIEGRRYDAELQMVHMGTGDADYMVTTVSVLIDASAIEELEEFQWLLDQWQQVANTEDQRCDNRLRYLYNEGSRRKLRTREEKSKKNDVIGNKKNRELQESPCKSDRFGRGCEPLGPRAKMYPYSLWPSIYYYGYRGSITTPPCSDIVNWRILDEPLKISRRQYRQMASLLKSSLNNDCERDTRLGPTGENYRPIQSFDSEEQKLFHCTYDDFSLWMYPPQDQ